MAQFKVGDKVRVKTEEPFYEELTEGEGIITNSPCPTKLFSIPVYVDGVAELAFKESEVFPILTAPLTITATLTTDTIPTDMLKQLSAAGFLITIKSA